MTGSQVRILIADDHEEFLRDLATKVGSRHQVVGTAVDGEQLLQLASATSPDLIITDITMPKVNGFLAVEQILARPGGPKAIFVSMHSSTNYVKRALQVGATGFVVKTHVMEQIDDAIQAVLDGQTYVSAQLGSKSTR